MRRGSRYVRGVEALSLTLGAVLLLEACGASERSDGAAPGSPVVARVNGEAIHLDQVESYVRVHGGSPRAALLELEDRALLRQAARDQGWRIASRAVLDERDERRVAQRVLLDLERENSIETVSDEDTRRHLREHLDEIAHGIVYECLQVLVQVPPNAPASTVEQAFSYARVQLERMRMDGVDSVWGDQRASVGGYPVIVQQLPDATVETSMPDSIRSLLFASTEEGPLASPVRTARGVHAIGVTRIRPAVPAESELALQRAREAVRDARRREAFEERLASLRSRARPSIREGAFARVFQREIVVEGSP